MNWEQNKSLKKSLFVNFLLLSLIMVLLFGTLIATILYYHGINSAYAVIRNKNQVATNYIEEYFTPLRTAVEFLAKKPEVINAAKNSQSQKEQVLSLFQTHNHFLPNIKYVFSGYEDGTLLIDNWKPSADYDPKKRPWYQVALKSSPNISGGIPYKDANTKEELVSISKALIDKDGKIQGVVAIDASIDAVTKNLFERDLDYSSSYSYVVDKEGILIIHHRRELLGKEFKEVVTTKDDIINTTGHSSYSFENTSKIAYHTNLESLGWTVVTVVNKQEILYPLLKS